MCSQSDDPTTYDRPAVTKPRTYVLAGDAPAERPHASVAMAVVGDMLDTWEALLVDAPVHLEDEYVGRVAALRDVRDRLREAKA